MAQVEREVAWEMTAQFATSQITLAQAEQLIARALSCSQQHRRPSESWEAEAIALLRVIDQDRKEKSHV